MKAVRLVLLAFLVSYTAGCVNLDPERARLTVLESRQALAKDVLKDELTAIERLRADVEALQHDQAVRELHRRQ